MGWLDAVPGLDGLYIGGLFSLRRREAVKEARISHVVSVLRWDVDQELIRPFHHLQIEVDDDEDEILLEYFPACNKFIHDALEAKGNVAMGKSRSATIVCAYLMHRFRISPTEALEQLRRGRGVCDPNDGFWKQLELYYSMDMADDVEGNPIYQRWLYEGELRSSRRLGQAPEADKIRFEDEHAAAVAGSHERELKCRRCRRTLCTAQYLVRHDPKQVANHHASPSVPPSACAHFFLEPLSWMRPELEQSKLEGRLECPKCKTNVGKYAWQGMQCSCGDWVVPAISLTKARVDENLPRAADSVARGMASLGIRHPPGREPGRENL